MTERFLDSECITGAIIKSLGETLSQTVGRKMTVQSRCLKSAFQNIVCGSARHPFFALPVPRWEQRTVIFRHPVSVDVPGDQSVNRLPSRLTETALETSPPLTIDLL